MASKKVYIAEFDAKNAAYTKKIEEAERRTLAATNKINSSTTKMKGGFNMAAAAMLKIGGAAYIVRSAFNFLKEARELALEQVKAERKVEQGVLSTGKAAGWSAEEIKKMASGLQDLTGIGDGAILSNVSGQLLTFTNIVGNEFKRAQKAILDVNAVINDGAIGSLTSQSIQLGKALNDPVANLGALSRVGIQFSGQQKEQIKQFTKQNELAKAQAIILDELEKQYGGQAEALAKATDGTMQLEAAIGDKMEIIGSGLNPVYKTYLSLMNSVLGLLIPTKDAVKEEYVNITVLTSKMFDANTTNEERISLYGELKKLSPDIVKGIDAENISLVRLSANLKDYNSKLIDRILLQRKEVELMAAGEVAADLRERKGEIEDKMLDALAEKKLYLIEQEDKHRKAGASGYEMLTARLNKFNEVMESNLSLEEKVKKLQQEKIIGQYTNFWNDLTNQLGRVNGGLKEQENIMNSLGTEANKLKESLGYVKLGDGVETEAAKIRSVVNELEKINEIDLPGFDDPLLGNVVPKKYADDIIEKYSKLHKEYRDIDAALKDKNLSAEVEIELMQRRLKVLKELSLYDPKLKAIGLGEDFEYSKSDDYGDNAYGSRKMPRTEKIEKPVEDLNDAATNWQRTGKAMGIALNGMASASQRIASVLNIGGHTFVGQMAQAVGLANELVSIISSIFRTVANVTSAVSPSAGGGDTPTSLITSAPSFSAPSFSVPSSSFSVANNFNDRNIVNSLGETNNLLRAQNMDLIKLMHGAVSGKMSTPDFEKILTKFVTRGQQKNSRNNYKVGR